MTLDAVSRVQLIDVPLTQPGTCVMCGVDGSIKDSRKFVDFGFQLDWYGAVIFCTACLAPVAEACSYVSATEYETIKALAETIKPTLDSLQNENRILKDAMVALLSNRGFEPANGDSVADFVEGVSAFVQVEHSAFVTESNSSESGDGKESGSVRTDSDSTDDGDSDLF